MKWQELLSKKASKKCEQGLLIEQIKLLRQEVILRQNLINQLFEKHSQLQKEYQDISDQLLEIEYQSLVKHGL